MKTYRYSGQGGLRWRPGRDGASDGAPLPPVAVPLDSRFRDRSDAERRKAALRPCREQFDRNTAAGPLPPMREADRAAASRLWDLSHEESIYAGVVSS